MAGLFDTIAAMEADEREMEAVRSLDEPEDLEETTELETEIIENDEREREVREMERDMDSADTAVRSMESLINSLELIRDSGGLNRSGAAMLNHARLSNSALFGHRAVEETNLVSLESFGDTSSRQYATELALEAEKEKHSNVLKAIWEFIKKWAAKVVEIVKSYTTATGIVKRRATKLRAQAEARASSSDKKIYRSLTEAQKKKYGKVFYTNGKVIGADDALKLVGTGMRKMSNDKFADKVLNALKRMEALANSNAFTHSAVDDFLANSKLAINGGIEGFFREFSPDINKAPSGVAAKAAKGDGTYFTGPILPGEMAVLFFAAKDPTRKEKEFISRMDISFMRVSNIPETAMYLEKDMPGSASAIRGIASEVLSICEDRDKVNKVLTSFTNNAKTYVDKMGKAASKVDPESRTILSRIGTLVRSMFSSVVKPFTEMSRYCITVCKYALEIASIALKAEKKEKKEDKDKK